ncbi:MAG: RsmB/NOP family class I SAM-dependent RNA methyltransferase [Puniceicoccaceae bacterium]
MTTVFASGDPASTIPHSSRAVLELIQRWRESRPRIDKLEQALRHQPPEISRPALAILRSAIREDGRIEALLVDRFQRSPHPLVINILVAALAEWFLEKHQADGQLVHFWVEVSKKLRSKPESRLVNAVLRRTIQELRSVPDGSHLLRQSHPEWWLQSWEKHFSAESISALLSWNQKPADYFLRWLSPTTPAPPQLLPTDHPLYLKCPLDLVEQIPDWYERGLAIVQDPGQRHPVDLLLAGEPRRLLDACAAPGGKSIALAAALGPDCEVVANDLPGRRQERLARHLRDLPWKNLRSTAHDFREKIPAAWEHQFDAVLVDAPCSNSGILRRRPDVKWRMSPSRLGQLVALQERLLTQASAAVSPRGVLLYSTCSIDPEENRQLVDRFLQTEAGTDFRLEEALLSFPWQDSHDGAAAFLMRRHGV